MRKAIRLFFIFFKINWMQETEYRVNLLVNSLMGIIWSFTFILFVQVIFGHVRSIAGWTKLEIMLLSVTQMLTWGVMNISLLPGMSNLSGKIKQGSLDMALVKPVSPRLLMAIADQNIDGLLYIVVLFVTAMTLANNINNSLLGLSIGGYILLVILGAFILSNVYLIIHSTAFWLIDLFNISHLNSTIANSAQFPPEIFNPKIRLVFCYLIPTVFISTVPTKVLLGGSILPSVLLAVIIAIFTFIISQMFWNFALRHYSSASS